MHPPVPLSSLEPPRPSLAAMESSTFVGTTHHVNNNSNNNHSINNNPPRRSAALSGTELTLIEVPPMRFLLMDAPRQANVHLYLKEMGKYHVTDVVRVCEPTYPTTDLQNAGIHVHEMEYKDGSSPSPELILSWLQLVEQTFFYTAPPSSDAAIAVHCVAGLGRAPVLIAIALIEFGALDPIAAVRFIRERRRGAINNNQLNYLQGYKKGYRRGGGGTAVAKCGCVIS
jgi:protein tyrosine phosphatase type IVA